FPESLPDTYRRVLIADNWSAAYLFFSEEVDLSLASLIVRDVEERVAESTGLDVALYGSVALKADLYESTEENIRRIDVVTIGLVGPLMILVSRSLAIPILIIAVALSSLVVSFGTLSLLSILGVEIYYLSRLVAIPIVIGIAVDYSIYYIYRVMEEYKRLGEWGLALKATRASAGRALLLGGVSVILGFLAYVLTPNQYIRSIGLALVISSTASFLAAYTFLPSLLELLLKRMPPRPPVGSAARSALLRRMAAYSMASKRVVAVASLATLLAAFAVVVWSGVTTDIRLALPSEGIYNVGYETYSAYFPVGFLSKLYVVQTQNGSPGNPGSLDALLERFTREGLIEGYEPVEAPGLVVYEASLPLDPFSDAAVEAVSTIRSGLEGAGGGPLVTGIPAIRLDVISLTNEGFYKVTIPVASILITMYLLAATGSALIPLRLLFTIAVSVVTSLALTRAFAWGVQGDTLYWTVPLIVVGLMLTLGMDYDIFLTSRILEEVRRGKSLGEAIEYSVESTGPAITVCGILLAAAFSSLVFTTLPMLVQTGIAVAVSILLDTFLVRPVLVPAILSLAGNLNWWPRLRADK
ncbi:MAG: MMPL family transporter, partial [Desulfurococcales archaeon]|nr:MMPL family transporter [Desulfurococcales archaeon]